MTEFGTQVHVAGGYGTTSSTPDALLTRNTKRCLNHRARATPEGANDWTPSCCHKQHGMHLRRWPTKRPRCRRQGTTQVLKSTPRSCSLSHRPQIPRSSASATGRVEI